MMVLEGLLFDVPSEIIQDILAHSNAGIYDGVSADILNGVVEE
jgi:hypothetical protein